MGFHRVFCARLRVFFVEGVRHVGFVWIPSAPYLAAELSALPILYLDLGGALCSSREGGSRKEKD